MLLLQHERQGEDVRQEQLLSMAAEPCFFCSLVFERWTPNQSISAWLPSHASFAAQPSRTCPAIRITQHGCRAMLLLQLMVPAGQDGVGTSAWLPSHASFAGHRRIF
jgi:hypothetical protein